MHETAAPRKRVFLVGAEIVGLPGQWPAEDSLSELALLADTAGLDVVGQMYQRFAHPSPKYFIGPGKLRDLIDLRDQYGYDMVVFDDELTPAQTRNLERELGLGVLDRTALILDIFAQHAHTHEGRLQVELAQYEYLLPRLRRQWTHLERQAGSGGTSAGGAVGLRGPGETQLELDRRAINQRIAWLKTELDGVHRHRELYRKRRRQNGVPIAALVGYTNAGKSSLLNALSGATVRAEDQLFATLDPTTRQITLPGGQTLLLTDTVGFIQKLPTQLIAAFRATLEEISEADILVHVLDITHPNAEEQTQAVEVTLRELGIRSKPLITVLNKVDRMQGMDAAEVAGLAAQLGMPDTFIAVSARCGWGLEQLSTQIEAALASTMVALDVLIPYQRNDLVSLWHERGIVESQQFEADGTHLKGRVPHALSHRFAHLANGA